MTDQIVKCRHCKGPLCYERHDDNVVFWDCLQCGYSSNSMFINGTDIIFDFEKTLPQLFQDIKYVDSDSMVWYPTVINKTEEGIGIITPWGKSKEDWLWGFIPAVEVSEEEKEKFRNPEGGYFKYKTDAVNIITFPRQDFYAALEMFKFI